MEEDIKEAIEYLEKRLSLLHRNYQFATEQAIEILIKGYRELEEKLMYALSPTTHELATTTKENFKKIIRENIKEDTYTIKRMLKKCWEEI